MPSTTPLPVSASIAARSGSSIRSSANSDRPGRASRAAASSCSRSHCKASRDVGLSEEQIEAIPHWAVADCYSPIERAVLAYTDCLVLDGGRTPDGVFDALREALSDEEILELTYVVELYDLHATMCRALRLEYDDVDERIVEVPAPEGGGDFMAGVGRED